MWSSFSGITKLHQSVPFTIHTVLCWLDHVVRNYVPPLTSSLIWVLSHILVSIFLSNNGICTLNYCFCYRIYSWQNVFFSKIILFLERCRITLTLELFDVITGYENSLFMYLNKYKIKQIFAWHTLIVITLHSSVVNSVVLIASKND